MWWIRSTKLDEIWRMGEFASYIPSLCRLELLRRPSCSFVVAWIWCVILKKRWIVQVAPSVRNCPVGQRVSLPRVVILRNAFPSRLCLFILYQSGRKSLYDITWSSTSTLFVQAISRYALHDEQINETWLRCFVVFSQLDLESEEEFKATMKSKGVDLPEAAHEIMLNRLAHEYEERKELCATLEELKSKRKVRPETFSCWSYYWYFELLSWLTME